ncbi:MAG: hypothetical protein WKF90_09610 [Pyrinomonadaceae bacterium]|jgi:predicted negative regulator of RcsB-dependent stress response
MYKFSTRFFIVIITFVIGIFAVTTWFYYQESQKNKIVLPNARWESIFFKGIDQATNLGGLTELRKTILRKGDVEFEFGADSDCRL